MGRVVDAADRGLAGVVAAEPWVRFLAGGARYGVAAVLSVVVYPVLTAGLYVLLLLWAAFTGQNAGGPLALPLMVLLGGVVGVACTVVAVALCAVVEMVTARRRVPRAVSILWSLVLYALAAAGLAWPLQHSEGWELPPLATVAIVLAAAAPAIFVVLVVAHSTGALTGLALRLARRRVDRTA